MLTSPFLYVGDSNYRSIGWALINAPIATRLHHVEFTDLSRAGFRFAGMTSYMTFPRHSPRDLRDYDMICEAWCHCFREPDRYIHADVPKALISYSDFTDYVRISAHNLNLQARDKFDHDFLYVGASEPWKRVAKNSLLAARCIPRICRELHLKALVIDEPPDGFPDTSGISFIPSLPWDEFLVRLARTRFLFVPNLHDPSPKILAEAICLDVPLVVNRNILGGWKYVNAFTGEFFDDMDNVVEAVSQVLSKPRSPRRWFTANYGPYRAGQRLLRLLRSLDPQISEQSHLTITESTGVLTAHEL